VKARRQSLHEGKDNASAAAAAVHKPEKGRRASHARDDQYHLTMAAVSFAFYRVFVHFITFFIMCSVCLFSLSFIIYTRTHTSARKQSSHTLFFVHYSHRCL
jgi:hypothetical protein